MSRTVSLTGTPKIPLSTFAIPAIQTLYSLFSMPKTPESRGTRCYPVKPYHLNPGKPGSTRFSIEGEL